MSYEKDKMTQELNELADKIIQVTHIKGKKTINEMRVALNAVPTTFESNIQRTKYNDYQFVVMNSNYILPSDDIYITCENACQKFYARNKGVDTND